VPDIIKTIFREHGMTDFDESLSGTYPSQEFTVQYRESDFQFVSRLMEREGIYYFFEHHPDRHKLVLADTYIAHEPALGYETIPYYPKQEKGRRERDHIDIWKVSQKLTPSACVLDDYDFTRPKANLTAKLISQSASADAELEIYDYPGAYSETTQGEAYARVRLEEHNAQQEFTHGEGDARGITVGSLFTLTNHPRQDQSREYLVVSAAYELQALDYESGSKKAGGENANRVCHCTFSTIPSSIPFRAESSTKRPNIRGAQTAVVVGKSGEEIWTDEYGRVKLQFRWDRDGGANEDSSCWVRVAQLWGGAGWGAIHVPRIGQEVIVEFLEGDPDRPIVTGRVYNADNMPPYPLPQNQTQSGIKSSSTADGAQDNFNELRFEDKKGAEQVYLQAEKDLDTYVKNDETRTVDHDRTKHIKNDETTAVGGCRTESVGKDETITIDGARTETVANNETITINGSRSERVAGSEAISISGSRTEDVGGDETINIKGARSETVSGSETVSVGASRSHTIGGDGTNTIGGVLATTVGADESLTVSGARTIAVGANGTLTIGGARSLSVGGNDSLTVGGSRNHEVGGVDQYTAAKFVVDAQGGIELTAGGSSIKIGPAGIQLKGAQVKVIGDGMVDVKAGGVLSLSGSLIKQG
jgi:type VI secretion system secreted protein VgrG